LIEKIYLIAVFKVIRFVLLLIKTKSNEENV